MQLINILAVRLREIGLSSSRGVQDTYKNDELTDEISSGTVEIKICTKTGAVRAKHYKYTLGGICNVWAKEQFGESTNGQGRGTKRDNNGFHLNFGRGSREVNKGARKRRSIKVIKSVVKTISY